MTHIRLSRFFSFFISLSLLLAPFPLAAMAQGWIAIPIADVEAELSMQPSDFNKFLNELSMIEMIEPGDETAMRPFTNIIQVQGLLSVNDELVENITAVNLSVTDEIVQNSTISNLSVTEALVVNATVGTLSITDLIVNNMEATNISVTNETVTGILSANDEVINNYLRFKDASTNYIGVQAPSAVTSYTVTLPAAAPTANQVLQAGVTPTNLTWATNSAFVIPANSKTIYVATYGNDITGNGSLATPYATLAKAIDIANSLASSSNPITISIDTGIYIEDNSVSPLTVTADGIAIIGQVSSNVILMPNTPANNFILVNTPIHISDITLESSSPSATGLTLAAGNFSAVINVDFVNFLVGAECQGSPTNSYGFINCFFVNNGTGLMVSNAYVAIQEITLFGTSSPTGPSVNNGITITGSGANLIINGGVIGLCETGITLLSNAVSTITGLAFRLNTFDINQSGASNLALSACTFQLTTESSDIEIQASGAGTITEIVGCQFDGSSLLGTPEGTGIMVTDNAIVNLNSGSMSNYTTALSIGLSTDTASTSLVASSFIVNNCTHDIIQQGSASLNLNASTASSNAITINDTTNVKLAFFDLDSNDSLFIGSTKDQDTTLLQAGITQTINPEIDYLSSLYSTQAIGLNNQLTNPTSWFVLSQDNANFTALTTDNTDIAGLRLVSDTGSPVGGTSALRGWDVDKNATSAELSFQFQNSDTSGSKPVVSEYTVMQLDGFNNQVQLPTAGTKIVFDADTNLYRSAASVLKTDSNFIVNPLTAGRAVITDPVTNELASSVTTSTELGYVSGVTSSIQTQINSKVAKAGDTMTGALTLPAGSAASPSLEFTGSTNTGLSAATANVLSFDINGSEKMNLSSSGLTIDAFSTAGVVHNSSAGLLSSSLIVDADITAATITNDKLANISSSNIANDIVVRDGSGNFVAGTITASLTGHASLDLPLTGGTLTGTLIVPAGSAAAPSLQFTGSTNTGVSAATANVLSFDVSGTEQMNISASGVTIDGFTPTAGIVHNNSSGLLSSSLIVNADVSASAGIVDTKLATISTAGKVANSATTATNLNTANAIVARDASGSFAAGLISITDEVISNSVTITSFSTAGVVHNNSSGLLSSSLIVDADITAATITNDKLANISSSNVPGDIVVRDGSGNFATNMITIAGTTTNNTDVATKAYVDAAVSTGLVAHTPCVVVSTTDIGSPPSGAQTIDGYAVVTNDRILLVGQTNEIYNGIWLANTSGAWTYPTDWAVGTQAGEAYVLITSGSTNAGSSWLCNTPTAVIGTNNITFAEFSLPSTTTGNNVGGGSGQVFQSKTGVILNFRTLSVADTYLSITTNSDNVGFSTNATSANTASKIVARDGSGNFAAGTITASLTGHASLDLPLTGGTLTGALTVPAGTIAAPSIEFTGSSTGTGFSAPTANQLSFDISGTEKMNISASGITIDAFSTAGVVHNSSAGLLTSSLIVNADVDPAAAIVDTKLNTISTAGKVANSATTATSANTASAIVARDASGNFAAGTITASLTGHASSDLPLTGGTLTGTLTVPAGTAAAPSLQFTGSTNTGLSAATANVLSFDVSGTEQMNISASGVTIDGFTPTAGIVHNNSSGLLSSSLIVNADVSASAAIVDTKLATISTAGKVANSATTATNLNTASAIVARDASGSFAAGLISITDEVVSNSVTITPFSTAGVIHNNSSGLLSSSLIVDADITAATITNDKLANISSSNVANDIVVRDASGNFAAGTITASLTGGASLDLPLAGGTMTGTLQLPAGTTASPSLIFTGSTTAGLSATTGNLSFSTNALERLKISSGGTISIDAFTSAGVLHNDTSGNLSSSLIVNADVSASAAIVDTKLATISTAGKVANSATTATNLNTASAIVARDASGSFAAGLISITDEVVSNSVTITPFSTAGVVHNSSAGLLSSSLIVDADITAATITNDKLANISSSNIANDIVVRDASGNFAAGTITASLTGHASLDLPLTGGTLTGTLTLPAGTAAAPSLQFTGSTNTGLSAATANVLSFDISGSEKMNLSSSGLTIDGFSTAGVVHNSAAGLLSSSLIVNADITNATITNAKLANISSSNIANDIVVRDGTGSFAAQEISMNDGILAGNLILTTEPSTSTAGNIIKGSSRFIHDFGTNNTFVGINAGNFSTSGTGGNSALGNNALTSNTTGTRNSAFGYSALSTSTADTDNTAMGYNALTANSGGSLNTAVGSYALTTNNSGTNNTAVGADALYFNTTGSYNTAIGNAALDANTIGAWNTAVGAFALNLNTTGNNNTAIGYSALGDNTIGTRNTALGYNALAVSTTGTNNTAIGYNALAANATGTSFNTAVGSNALAANTTGVNNTAIGYNSLPSAAASYNVGIGYLTGGNSSGNNNTWVGTNAGNNGSNNVGIGYSTLSSTTANNNTAIGYNAMTANTTGASSVAVGYSALAANTVGINNTALGYNALAVNTTGSNNTAIGTSALLNNTIGTDNVAVGVSALQSNTTGYTNIAVGSQTLLNNTIGISNIAIGYQALQGNTTGNYNTAVGLQTLNLNTVGTVNTAVGAAALQGNTTGFDNTAVGGNALQQNTTGCYNTACGQAALGLNTIGSQNTACGQGALANNTTGGLNTAVGTNSLNVNTIGAQNTACGQDTLQSNTTGNYNTACGQAALQANTIGVSNTACGQVALLNNITGNYNTAVGANALQSNTIGIQNTAVGANALQNNTANFNTAVGFSALQANTTGVSNTAVGVNVLIDNTIGNGNTAIGTEAMHFNTTGGNNTAVGINALQQNTTGNFNTAVGQNALNLNTTGINNTAMGVSALASNTTGTSNNAYGGNALQNNTIGIQNTAIGGSALFNNTTGNYNTALGAAALTGNTIGSQNVAVGQTALQNNTSGNNNTAVGINALLSLTTGSNNTAIGTNAGNGTITTGSNNIYIGNGITAASANESNVTRIGNIRSVTTGTANAITVLIDSNNQLGTVSSTRKVKHAIEDMNDESAALYNLRPVSFVYNSDASETKQYGLIAEEVEEVFPEIVARNKDGEIETVLYHVLPVLLLNEMQKQQETTQQQQKNIENLTITTEKMSAAIVSLQEQIAQFSKRIKILENHA